MAFWMVEMAATSLRLDGAAPADALRVAAAACAGFSKSNTDAFFFSGLNASATYATSRSDVLARFSWRAGADSAPGRGGSAPAGASMFSGCDAAVGSLLLLRFD